MEKSTTQWYFLSDWSWERVSDLARPAGFQGLEIFADHLHFFAKMDA